MIVGPSPEFDSVGLGWGLAICVSYKLPGEVAGLGTPL